MKRIFTLAVVLIPFLCVSLTFSQPSQKNSYDYGKHGAQRFPARGGSVDWGLALSGGGPRSALFSIGVMKALYEMKVLDDIDVISSTSGGSYALYWLLTSYDTSDNQRFGYARFDNSVFLQQICSLQNKEKSNFFPSARVPGAIPTADRRFNKYEEAIIQSFGDEKKCEQVKDKKRCQKEVKEVKIDFLNDAIKDRKVPYFIINTEIGISKSDIENKQRSDLARVFEITPQYRGNLELKFRDWNTKESADIPWPLSKSVATSGIPTIAFAKRGIMYKGKKFLMSDGGEVENLAALSLIGRGVKNIIIVDSEQDPRYRFGAYRNLQKMLGKMDIGFNVGDIDKFLKDSRSFCKERSGTKKGKKCLPALSKGQAKSTDDGGTRINSNIYYVKMSDPKGSLPELFTDTESDKQKIKGKLACKQKEKDKLAWGECLVRTREDERCPPNDDCHCNKIKLDFSNADARDAFYSYVVKGYSEYLNNLRPWYGGKTWIRVLPFKILGKMCPFLSYNFPHTTTIDLTFFADQLEAFVGLGYLQGMKLESHIGSKERIGVVE